MKKKLICVLAFVLVLALTGCSKSQGTVENKPASGTETVENVKPAETKTEEVQEPEVKPEVSQQEEIVNEEPAPAQTEEVKTEEVKAEEVKTEEVKAEEIKAEEVKTEEAKAEEEKTEEPEPEVPTVGDLSIKELFGEYGMKAGICLTTRMIRNSEMNELITSQYNSVTMENAMKPDYIFNKKESIAKGELVVEFNDDVIEMLDWARENGMAVRGHTLVWYSQTPSWIFHEDFNTSNPYVDRDVMLGRMESMIKQVFEKLDELGYIDLFYAYDVVNEAWNEDGTMRTVNNPWHQIIGDDYVWHAFYYANKYAPESIDLYLNDYNEQYKYKNYLKVVKTLVDEEGNYLLDGLGLQAHLYTSDDLDSYFAAVDKLASTGLKIQLTELDVALGSWTKPLKGTEENLLTQGRYYYNLINGLLERAANGTVKMDALTFWGFADNLSWRSAQCPLLFNRNLEPKYSYFGVMQVKEKAGFTEEQ